MCSSPDHAPRPTHCDNGHELSHGRVTVGWLPCPCAGGRGHRTWRCDTCGSMTYRPDHDEDEPGLFRYRVRS